MSVSHAHVSNLSCDPWRTSWARRDFLCHHRETFSRCVWLLEMEIIWGLCSKGGGAGWGKWSATGKSPLDSTLLLLSGCPGCPATCFGLLKPSTWEEQEWRLERTKNRLSLFILLPSESHSVSFFWGRCAVCFANGGVLHSCFLCNLPNLWESKK